MKKNTLQQGQVLIEILLAILIAAAIIGAVSGLIFTGQKSGQNSGLKSSAISLVQEGFEAIQTIGESGWHNIYMPPIGASDPITSKSDYAPDNVYYIYKNGSSWALGKIVGSEGDITVGNAIYSRKIYIYNVNRNPAGNREIVSSGGVEDPSTQRIKIVVSVSGAQDAVMEEYLTRWKNNTFNQNDWSGGSGQAGPIIAPNDKYDSNLDGNIDISTPGTIKLK